MMSQFVRGAGIAALLVAAAMSAEARTWRIAPGSDAQTRLQEAMLTAQPGDTIRIARGRYDMTAGLSLDIDGVTVRGEGHERTILSFANQTQGAEGLIVTSDRVVLRDFAVEDSKGDAIKARDCDQITFSGVRAEWTRGPHSENGAYGLYPVNCSNVLIENSIARGASDAGLYVGQSRNIVVRGNLAEYNVAGIEIENSFNADVRDNIARHNTGGILVFDLPGLQQMGGHDVRVFKNRIEQNNTPNFAPEGNIVAGVPAGTGMIIMANRNVHVFDNLLADNASVNVLISAYRFRIEDPNYNPLPRDIVIRGNRFGAAGFQPAGTLAALAAAGVQLPDVLWDGATTYAIPGSLPRTETVRIAMEGNRGVNGDGDPTYLSNGILIAGGDFSEAAPNNLLTAAARDIAEPAAVRLAQD